MCTRKNPTAVTCCLGALELLVGIRFSRRPDGVTWLEVLPADIVLCTMGNMILSAEDNSSVLLLGALINNRITPCDMIQRPALPPSARRHAGVGGRLLAAAQSSTSVAEDHWGGPGTATWKQDVRALLFRGCASMKLRGLPCVNLHIETQSLAAKRPSSYMWMEDHRTEKHKDGMQLQSKHRW